MFNFKSLYFLISISAAFSLQAYSSEEAIKVSNGKINICNGKVCEEYHVPADVVIDSGVAFESKDIDDEPGNEILVVTKSDVNSCSTVLYVDKGSKELKAYYGARDICNFTQAGNGLIVSNFRDAAMWKQELIKVKNRRMELVFTDSCLDCEEIKREYMVDGSVKKMLVSKSENIFGRHQIQGVVVSDKAKIASSLNDLENAKAYLIKGDKVLLVDSASDDDNNFFFLVDYKGKNEKIISRWVRCDDLDVCD